MNRMIIGTSPLRPTVWPARQSRRTRQSRCSAWSVRAGDGCTSALAGCAGARCAEGRDGWDRQNGWRQADD